MGRDIGHGNLMDSCPVPCHIQGYKCFRLPAELCESLRQIQVYLCKTEHRPWVGTFVIVHLILDDEFSEVETCLGRLVLLIRPVLADSSDLVAVSKRDLDLHVTRIVG